MRILENPQEVLEVFSKVPILGLDLETSGKHHIEDDIAVVGIASDQIEDVAVLHTYHTGIPEPIKELLSLHNLFITQNGTIFDLPFLLQVGIEIKNHYDILIAEQVINTANRKDVRLNLGAIMERRIGRSFKRSVSHSGWTAPSLTHEQKMYVAGDIAYLCKIYKIQMIEAKKRKLEVALSKEQEVTTKTAKIVHNGVAFSSEVLNTKREDLLDDMIIAKYKLQQEFGWDFNANSSQKVVAALATIGIDVPDSTAGTLSPIAENNSLVKMIQDIKQATRRTGLYDPEFERNFVVFGRLYAKYWQLGTETTRFSSTEPNLNQIPKNMRSFIGNEPGYKVVSADFAQLEVRIAADISGDRNLIDALDSEDLHDFMAREMYGQEEVTKKERDDGKAGTFTWIFAGGHEGIIRMGRDSGKIIPEPQAKKMIRGLRRRFPGVSRWHGSKRQKVSRRYPVSIRLPWGHRRSIMPGAQNVQKFVNTEVQGTAAIGMKEALIEADRRGLMEYIGLTIYDELVATSVPEEEAEDFRVELEDAMKVGMGKVCSVPIEVESEVGDVWKDKA